MNTTKYISKIASFHYSIMGDTIISIFHYFQTYPEKKLLDDQNWILFSKNWILSFRKLNAMRLIAFNFFFAIKIFATYDLYTYEYYSHVFSVYWNSASDLNYRPKETPPLRTCLRVEFWQILFKRLQLKSRCYSRGFDIRTSC